jgi:hypothetical protein
VELLIARLYPDSSNFSPLKQNILPNLMSIFRFSWRSEESIQV